MAKHYTARPAGTPPLMTPFQLLRDTCIAAVALTFGGVVSGAGVEVAAGALAATANLLLLVRAVGGLSPANFAIRLLLAHLGAFGMLAALLSVFGAAPVLVGFCAPLVALSARALLGLRSSTPLSAEHG